MSKAATLQHSGLEAQRLRGKVFFVDLQDDPKSLEGIQRAITERGGVVDGYFHKQVHYLITTRHKKGKKASTGCPPSPLSVDTSEGAEGGAKVSKAAPTYCTRAAKIYAMSRALHGTKVDNVLKVADQWGIKVLTPNELLTELKFKPLPPPKDDSKKHFKARELNPPFMKVEDQSRAYRPLIYETEVWPRPSPHCPAHSCPYKTPQTSKSTQLSRARLTQELVASQQAGATVAMAATTAARRICECCSMRYEDLNMHLRSKKHQDYANNNFSALDGFMQEKGLDLATFLTRIRKKTSSVVLTTPPTSPQSDAQGTPCLIPTGQAVEPTLERGHHTPSNPHPHPLTPTCGSGCPQDSKRELAEAGGCVSNPSL